MGAVKAAGGMTIAQSEESCVVYGMPKAAIERGFAVRVVGLDVLANTLQAQCMADRKSGFGSESGESGKAAARTRLVELSKLEQLRLDFAIKAGGVYGAVCIGKTQQGRSAGPLPGGGRFRLRPQEPGPHRRNLWRPGGGRSRRRHDRHHRIRPHQSRHRAHGHHHAADGRDRGGRKDRGASIPKRAS